jgi:hypothetical protein
MKFPPRGELYRSNTTYQHVLPALVQHGRGLAESKNNRKDRALQAALDIAFTPELFMDLTDAIISIS